jgi:4-cresol dehydrogenase (hydroxylating)
MTAILPPGLSPKTFAEAVAALEAAVGQTHVETRPEELELYRDPWSLYWNEAREYRASAVVRPASAEAVAAVVRIANRFRLPLYPISTGKNQTYGGAAPSLSGSVIVDLKRMNRVLAVDEDRHFALVEPGVTYFDLYRYIQDHKLKVWIDVPATGWGSLVGNALDHGVGYTAGAFRDHFGSHCGLEAVLPTGEIMRTGMGALPGADTWQDFKYGAGPSVDGLFAQGNFGIVTKMGFWLMPQPEAWLNGYASCQHYDDFDVMVKAISHLEDAGIVTGKSVWTCTAYHPFEGNLPSAEPRPSRYDLMAHGWPTLEQTVKHARQHGGHAWRVNMQIYGPAKVVKANWEHVCDYVAAHVPESTFQYVETLTFPLTPEREARLSHAASGLPSLSSIGVPSLAIFNKTREEIAAEEEHAPGQNHTDFLAVVPRTAEAFMRAQKVLYESQIEAGAPWTVTPYQPPLTWFPHAFLIGAPVVSLFKGDPEANAKARKLYATYVNNMTAAGFAPYRTSPAMQDLLVSKFSFGDHALLRFQERLKDAADPNGVIAPGRYGLWPKAMRKGRA